ncbi:hypothetical protein BDQ12DRAFT_725575 [Crucibulum laeve]|uniref:Secreted protein n=1 Tax=Crucibulum laeve TaxID=68775 RepID=A0A5C3LS79_9AGAR|nr:hypothetical protein BDQ12DRAFT_725575 [Crucibulum laeve]
MVLNRYLHLHVNPVLVLVLLDDMMTMAIRTTTNRTSTTLTNMNTVVTIWTTTLPIHTQNIAITTTLTARIHITHNPTTVLTGYIHSASSSLGYSTLLRQALPLVPMEPGRTTVIT